MLSSQKRSHGTLDALSTRRIRFKRRGSTLVEFALLLPVLLAILLGIIEFGWLISRTYMVGNATREGARYGALGKPVADTKARVRATAPNIAITDAHITLQYQSGGSWIAWPADNAATGKNGVPVDAQIKVTVSTPHTSLTRFFPFLSNRNITQFTVMRREL